MGWYKSCINKADQAWIADDQTGKDVAIVYDAKHAAIIAAAPELLALLKFMVEASLTEPGMNIYKAHVKQAEQIIARATGRE